MNERSNPSTAAPVVGPVTYQSHQASRLETLTPEARAVEQRRQDAITPEERAADENRWNALTPAERDHQSAGPLHGQWLGPGYVLQGQVRLTHPTIEESWALRGLTAEEIATERQSIVDSRTQVNATAADERKALDARTPEEKNAAGARVGNATLVNSNDRTADGRPANLQANPQNPQNPPNYPSRAEFPSRVH